MHSDACANVSHVTMPVAPRHVVRPGEIAIDFGEYGANSSLVDVGRTGEQLATLASANT